MQNAIMNIQAPKALAVLLAAGLLLAACDDDSVFRTGIASLGPSFVRAFNQDRNDTPFDAQDIELVLTPKIEPFDP